MLEDYNNGHFKVSVNHNLNKPSYIDVEIELLDSKEITSKYFEKPMATFGVIGYITVFDVTDNSFIEGIKIKQNICKALYLKV